MRGQRAPRGSASKANPAEELRTAAHDAPSVRRPSGFTAVESVRRGRRRREARAARRISHHRVHATGGPLAPDHGVEWLKGALERCARPFDPDRVADQPRTWTNRSGDRGPLSLARPGDATRSAKCSRLRPAECEEASCERCEGTDVAGSTLLGRFLPRLVGRCQRGAPRTPSSLEGRGNRCGDSMQRAAIVASAGWMEEARIVARIGNPCALTHEPRGREKQCFIPPGGCRS